MLGLGWTEMLVVGVIALIVIGPKDLPRVMQQVGKYVGQIRRLGSEFQREINRSTGLDEVRNLRKSISDPLRKSTEEIRREFNTMSSSGKQQPSGKLKPSQPGKESVADEIRAAAGMPPRLPAKPDDTAVDPATLAASEQTVTTPAEATPAKKAPVKAAPRKVAAKPKVAAATQDGSPDAASKTTVSDLPPAKPKTAGTRKRATSSAKAAAKSTSKSGAKPTPRKSRAKARPDDVSPETGTVASQAPDTSTDPKES